MKTQPVHEGVGQDGQTGEIPYVFQYPQSQIESHDIGQYGRQGKVETGAEKTE